jgi:hypothetical protein
MPTKKGVPTKVRKALITLQEDLYKQLRHWSVETDCTMSEIVVEALTKHLKEKGGERKK